jgi:hypothetical protein
MDDNVLTHYGIRGMKWGVRRYQNKDGSLTSAGKKRYKKTPEQLESEAQKKQDVKNRGTFTTAELKQKIERLKLEKELKDLTKSEISSGRKFIEDVLKDVGKKTLTTVLTGAALYGAKAAISGEVNRKDLGEAIFNGGAKKK